MGVNDKNLAALMGKLERMQYQLVEELRAHLGRLAEKADVAQRAIEEQRVVWAALDRRIRAIEAALKRDSFDTD